MKTILAIPVYLAKTFKELFLTTDEITERMKDQRYKAELMLMSYR